MRPIEQSDDPSRKLMTSDSLDDSLYRDVMPWRVRVEHVKEYPARMLRILGKRRSGGMLTDIENQRLDAWLKKLDDDHAVIGYDPNSTFGFYYIEKDDQTDGANGVPIRISQFNTYD